MRKTYQALLKAYLFKKIRKIRKQIGMTQFEVSEILEMDLRSYSYIETGVHSCGTLSFILFLLYVSPNPLEVLEEIRKLFDEAKENENFTDAM